MKLYHPYKTEKTIAMADQNKIRKKILNQLLVQNDNNIDFFPQLSMFFLRHWNWNYLRYLIIIKPIFLIYFFSLMCLSQDELLLNFV